MRTEKRGAEETRRRLPDEEDVHQVSDLHPKPATSLIMTESRSGNWRYIMYHGGITAIDDWLTTKSSIKSVTVNREISEEYQELPQSGETVITIATSANSLCRCHVATPMLNVARDVDSDTRLMMVRVGGH